MPAIRHFFVSVDMWHVNHRISTKLDEIVDKGTNLLHLGGAKVCVRSPSQTSLIKDVYARFTGLSSFVNKRVLYQNCMTVTLKQSHQLNKKECSLNIIPGSDVVSVLITDADVLCRFHSSIDEDDADDDDQDGSDRQQSAETD